MSGWLREAQDSYLLKDSNLLEDSDLLKDSDLEDSDLLKDFDMEDSDLLNDVSCMGPSISWMSCLKGKSLLLSLSLGSSSWKLLRLLWRAELGSAGVLNTTQNRERKTENVTQFDYSQIKSGHMAGTVINTVTIIKTFIGIL